MTDTTRNLEHWLALALGAADGIRETCCVVEKEFGIQIDVIDGIVKGMEVIAAAGQAALRGVELEVPVARHHVYTSTATLRQQLAELDRATMKVCAHSETGGVLGTFLMQSADVIRQELSDDCVEPLPDSLSLRSSRIRYFSGTKNR